MNFYGKSDTGKVREANQDCFEIRSICKNASLTVVCDGMGGANAGNVASESAINVFVERVLKYCSPKINSDGVLKITSNDACKILNEATLDANKAVYKKAQSSPEYHGMGTTLVAALFCDEVAYVANVGDSRLYLISDGQISQITHDHSYVQHLVDSGNITPEEAASHPYRNRITRAVGIKNDVDVDIFAADLEGMELCYLLLCTDGLTGQIPAADIYCTVISETDAETLPDVDAELQDKVEKLIDAANAAGGPDNITVVLAKRVKEV